MKEWVPLAFLLLCMASFVLDTYNIIYFFNNGDVVFGFLTLFCLLVPGYFGKRHLLKNKEFFQQTSSDFSRRNFCKVTTMKTTFLYVFCVVTFPIFNVIFKATRLFQVTTSSSDQFALELDQVKSLFEDSPQLALQLYICFKSETHFAQKIAIIFSSLSLAVPNVRALKVIKKSWIDYNFFSLKKTGGKFEENWESRQKSLKSIAKHVAVYSLFFAMFVFVSFTRAASIAIICCFLSYNAILVYVATFLALKILFELAKLAMEHDALKKFSKERLGDIVANVFNILELRHDSFVTICYAVLWMIFNVTTIGSIMAYEKYGIVSSDDEILLHLWIAPSFELTDWSEMFIRKQGMYVQFEDNAKIGITELGKLKEVYKGEKDKLTKAASEL